MGLRARRVVLTTLIFALVGGVSQSAFADYSLTPNLPAPNSNSAIAGPTTAPLSSQEVTAFSGRAPDPYFEPKGIPLGGPFRLFPNLFTGVGYDSNVYRSLNAPQSDVFFDVNPTLVLDYDTSRARLDLYGIGDFTEYTKLTKVNTTNYNFGLDGSYLISGAATATGKVSYAQLAEPLSSSSVTAGQQTPSQYDVFDASGSVSYKPNRLGFSFGGSLDTYNYLNTLVGTTPSVVFGNKDRDNNLYKGFAQTSYDFSPGYSVFIRGVYNDDHYRPGPDRAGYFRSSHGFQADGGLDLLLGDLIQGEIYTGYVQQNYIHNQPLPLHNLSGIDFRRQFDLVSDGASDGKAGRFSPASEHDIGGCLRRRRQGRQFGPQL